MGKWKILWLVGFLWLGGLINPLKATAQENPAGIEGLEAWDLDYGEAERVLKEELELNSFDLGSYIQKIFSGEESFSLDSIWGYLKEGLVKEFEKDRNQLLRVVVIAVAAAVFTNFSNVFKSNQVADTGFYVAYLLMFSVLAASFFEISKTASLVLESLADFMKALAPAFFTTVTMASGAGTSLLFYQIALVVIWLVEMVLLKLILPLIHIYFVLHLLNHLMEKDVLSKTTQILEEGVNWSLKAMLGLVAGYN
ncbi:MAG: stage III sporulation protein AE, partial [Acetivibrio ethanolgignens]